MPNCALRVTLLWKPAADCWRSIAITCAFGWPNFKPAFSSSTPK